MSLRVVSKTERKIITINDIPSKEMFGDRDFIKAPDLYALCMDLINKHETQFSHLVNVAIEVLWKKVGGKSKGRVTLGKTQAATGLVGYFSECAFVIWIAADHCQEASFSDQQFQALLFHELCHISYDPEDGKLSLQGHDFEGFVSELRAYGAWDLTLKTMVSQAQQLSLFKLEESNYARPQAGVDALPANC